MARKSKTPAAAKARAAKKAISAADQAEAARATKAAKQAAAIAKVDAKAAKNRAKQDAAIAKSLPTGKKAVAAAREAKKAAKEAAKDAPPGLDPNEAYSMSPPPEKIWRDHGEKVAISSITREGHVATARCSEKHGLVEHDRVHIGAPDQAEYNLLSTEVKVIDEKTFTFEVNGFPPSPATGSLSFTVP